jgi:hypothetical protein
MDVDWANKQVVVVDMWAIWATWLTPSSSEAQGRQSQGGEHTTLYTPGTSVLSYAFYTLLHVSLERHVAPRWGAQEVPRTRREMER